MKELNKLIRLSAKRSFFVLRRKSPFRCKSLQNDVHVTQLFMKHISGERRNRSLRETFRRLLIIPFVDEIICKGKLADVRNKEGRQYFKLSLRVSDQTFSVIIVQQRNYHKIVSCFIA